MRTKKKVRTIEKTSKALKFQIAVSILLMIGSVFIMANAQERSLAVAGLGIFIFGFIWWMVTKMRVWWSHG